MNSGRGEGSGKDSRHLSLSARSLQAVAFLGSSDTSVASSSAAMGSQATLRSLGFFLHHAS